MGLFQLLLSCLFLIIKRGATDSNIESNQPIYIVIPLLREQNRIKNLVNVLEPILKRHENVLITLITTEREFLEKKNISNEPSTYEMVKDIIVNSKYSSRYFHFHFPGFNKVVAEQLNYGVSELKKSIGDDGYFTAFFAFYNADSKIDIELFDNIKGKLSYNKVLQQSSLFTLNIEEILNNGRYLTACFGIYQSIWTIKHEIPRLLIASNYYKFLPKAIANNLLNYCITHGLIIPGVIFDNIGGFPITKQGGEDIAIGYVLRANGYVIEPINNLENSETPIKFKSIWMQLAHWYVAVVSYLDFHNLLWKNKIGNSSKKIILLSTQGIYDALSWLFKGWGIIGYLILGYFCEKFEVSVLILLVNMYSSLLIFFLLNSRLPKASFPKFQLRSIIIFMVYPLTVVLRSFPAILGLVWFFRIHAGHEFIRSKTE